MTVTTVLKLASSKRVCFEGVLCMCITWLLLTTKLRCLFEDGPFQFRHACARAVDRPASSHLTCCTIATVSRLLACLRTQSTPSLTVHRCASRPPPCASLPTGKQPLLVGFSSGDFSPSNVLGSTFSSTSTTSDSPQDTKCPTSLRPNPASFSPPALGSPPSQLLGFPCSKLQQQQLPQERRRQG